MTSDKLVLQTIIDEETKKSNWPRTFPVTVTFFIKVERWQQVILFGVQHYERQ